MVLGGFGPVVSFDGSAAACAGAAQCRGSCAHGAQAEAWQCHMGKRDGAGSVPCPGAHAGAASGTRRPLAPRAHKADWPATRRRAGGLPIGANAHRRSTRKRTVVYCAGCNHARDSEPTTEPVPPKQGLLNWRPVKFDSPSKPGCHSNRSEHTVQMAPNRCSWGCSIS